MPEGDTIRKIAGRLMPLLLGKRLLAVSSHGGQQHPAWAGRRIEAIEPYGKHLTLRFDDGSSIRCHLGMKGSWHSYAPDEPWTRSPAHAALVLRTEQHVVVCFGARDVELASRRDPRAGEKIARLGPDLLDERLVDSAMLVDVLAEIVQRARAIGDRAIGEVLLDQRVLAGIGNVYKSEVLFLERTDPWCGISKLDDDKLMAIFRRARTLMAQNLGPGLRTTGAPNARHWVYRRAGRACLAGCGSLIRSALQGVNARRTYYCPCCQGAQGVKAGQTRASPSGRPA